MLSKCRALIMKGGQKDIDRVNLTLKNKELNKNFHLDTKTKDDQATSRGKNINFENFYKTSIVTRKKQ